MVQSYSDQHKCEQQEDDDGDEVGDLIEMVLALLQGGISLWEKAKAALHRTVLPYCTFLVLVPCACGRVIGRCVLYALFPGAVEEVEVLTFFWVRKVVIKGTL